MGHIQNADGTLTIQSTPTQTVADMQAIADRAETIGGLLTGTAAERGNLTAGQAKEGWLFSETDTGRIYQMRSGNWARFAGYSRGTYDGTTTSEGQATINHGLGVVPTSVIVTNRSGGQRESDRRFIINTKNASQVQFVVHVTDLVGGALVTSTFAGNRVVFDWVAYL